MKILSWVCLTISFFALGAHGAESPQGDNGPAIDLEALKQQHLAFMKDWGNTDSRSARQYFSTPEILEQAKQQSGYCRTPSMTVRSKHMEARRLGDDKAEVLWRTYWSYPIEPPNTSEAEDPESQRVALLVTDEFFIYDKAHKITEYRCVDVTDSIRAETMKRQKEHAEVMNDESRPRPERIGAGVMMFLNYWQIAAYDRLWPHLAKLLEMDVLNESEVMPTLQKLTRRAVRQGPLPDEYRQDVDRVLGWKSEAD